PAMPLCCWTRRIPAPGRHPWRNCGPHRPGWTSCRPGDCSGHASSPGIAPRTGWWTSTPTSLVGRDRRMLKHWPPMLAALWRYRGFVTSSVWREFSGRYRESLLGVLWAIAQPLAMIVIFVALFHGLMRPMLAGHEGNAFAFSIHVCIGVIAWTLFADMLSKMSTVFIDRASLIKKSTF